MVDKHVGADEVKQIIEPVNIFEVDSLEDELAGIEGAAAKADFIASRVKRTCTEKMEEDPVLYKKLSEVIDEAIRAYIQKRLSEEEYLQQMLIAWNEAKAQGAPDEPAGMRGHPDAKAYFRLLREGFVKAAGGGIREDLPAIAAETSLGAKKIIEEKKIRDWTTNRDVENSMINGLDDLLFGVKQRHNLTLIGVTRLMVSGFRRGVSIGTVSRRPGPPASSPRSN